MQTPTINSSKCFNSMSLPVMQNITWIHALSLHDGSESKSANGTAAFPAGYL
jgi:hypothetical protein